MWKKIGIGLLVALLVVGAVAGAVLAQEGDGPIDDFFAKMAQRLGLTRDDMLQQLLDGKSLKVLMADQGVTAREMLGNRRIFLAPSPRPPFFDLASIAKVLGMEPADLKTAFEDGQSLADVIAAQGLDEQQVLDDLVALAIEKVEAAQADGKITETQAEKLIERLQNADFGTDWMDQVPQHGLPGMEVIRERLQDSPAIILEDIAAAIGMEPEDLRQALVDGQSLAEVIEAQGLDADQVFEDVKAELVARFETVVEDKQEAVDRAERILEQMQAEDFGTKMWDRWLQWEKPEHPGMNWRDRLPWRAPRLRDF